ncbi:DNA integrity scanning protein DisA nucleotide-binding domain protein [Arenimonas sp.]|nr:DNA integrity scanning protein DisA nucleotide-binding domain protein [Candidatus Parcubacteria bacterium]
MELITYISKLVSFIPIKDMFDVLIITVCIYFVLVFIKQTRSFFILGALASLLILNFIAQTFDLTLTRQLVAPLLTLFIAIFVIVFQPEIRKFFKWISSGRITSFKKTLSVPENTIQTIVRAVFTMAKQRVGAILVLPGEFPLDDLLEGGFPLNGQITASIMLSIFDSSSPGHDGAVLIEGSQIKFFGLHLPLARDFNEYRRVGTRHRAGAGITERTDAMAIIVSEERGEVSVSTKGKLTKVATAEELADIIAKFTGDEPKNIPLKKSLVYQFFKKNRILKVAAVALGLSFWFFMVYKAGVIKISYSVPVEYRYVNPSMVIVNSLPDSISVTVTGNNTDIVNMKKDDIKVIVDASKFIIGENDIVVGIKNIQTPSYIELNNFTPKTVKVKTTEKSPN